jgi:hypothetical protein
MVLNIIYNLCTPAKLYFILSLILLAISFYYDITRNDKDKICLGKINCKVKNKPAMYSMNILFILLWTFILNILCSYGWSKLSWFLFLFPYVLLGIMFITITGLVIFIAKTNK